MSRISDSFKGKKNFAAYLMAGDPNLDKSAEYILALQEGGADLIEIGIPFSDPVAEGNVIQQSSARALSAGTNLDGIFEMLESIKEKITVPIVFMTYLNPVFVYGYHRFFERSQSCGICGVIIPDVPFEEQAEVAEVSEKYGIDSITLIAPTSKERTEKIAKSARGFVYLVSSLGVTGMRDAISADLSEVVTEIKHHTDIPVMIGFGISNPEQAGFYSQFADGVIVGSAIVKQIGKNKENTVQQLKAYVSKMKEAML